MGKEKKIGLAVIVSLLIVLGVMIVKRIASGGASDEAHAAEGSDSKSPLKLTGGPKQPTLTGAKPTAPKMPTTLTAAPEKRPATAGWEAASKRRADADPPTSFMPKNTAPLDRNAAASDSYDARYGTPDNRQEPAVAMASDNGPEVPGVDGRRLDAQEPARYGNAADQADDEPAAPSRLKLAASGGPRNLAPEFRPGGSTAIAADVQDEPEAYAPARQEYANAPSGGANAPGGGADEAYRREPAGYRNPAQEAPQPAAGVAVRNAPTATRSQFTESAYRQPGQPASKIAPAAARIAQPASQPGYPQGNQVGPANAGAPATGRIGFPGGGYRGPATATATPAGIASQFAPRGPATALGPAYQSPVELRENTGAYHVEPGDSFWKISQKIYGEGGYFKALQEHNRSRFPNPGDLQVGTEVLTPPVEVLREKYSGMCPKLRKTKPGTPTATVSRVVAGPTRQYVVEEGDTLFDIARHELGDSARWPEIFQLNREVLGEDIDYVRPGLQLILPSDVAADAHTEPASEDTLTRRPGALRR